MSQIERIIIVDDDPKALGDYERYVANRDGKSSEKIEPLGDTPISLCKDLDCVKSYLEETGFAFPQPCGDDLKEVYDGAQQEGDPIDILVVDDYDWVCLYLRHSLQYQRYIVPNLENGNQLLVLIRDRRRCIDTANDADSALRSFKRKKHQFVFTDLWMPTKEFKKSNQDWDKTLILSRIKDPELHEGSQGVRLIEKILSFTESEGIPTPHIIPFSSQWEHHRIKKIYAERIYPKCGIGILPKHYSFEYAHRSTFDGLLNSILLNPRMSASLYTNFLNVLKFSIEEVRKRKRIISNYRFAQTTIVGSSEKILSLLDMINRIAPTEKNVLITGETGTGKELIARLIHEFSHRSGQFTAINCGALLATLVESELFGHEKHAFTDARTQKLGLFETAGEGTIFLDEINSLDITLQPKLLRALDQMTFRRVGGLREIPLRARIIAAMNQDPQAEIQKGRLRADLFYRLGGNTFRFDLPPLRERRQDILLLAQHFVKLECEKRGKKILGIDPEAEKLLENHDWPGNVRELKSVMEHAVITAGEEIITSKDLHSSITHADVTTDQIGSNGGIHIRVKHYKEDLAEFHRKYITDALKKTGYIKLEAARLLGISRNTLDKRLKEYNLKVEKELNDDDIV